MGEEPAKAINIFYCYAHEDRAWRDELERHLGALKRLGRITGWYDRDIQAGTEWEREIENHLTTASIILLLISADFIHSDYCYGLEMQKALELHRAGRARVIPILLRPVDVQGTPIVSLQMLPTDGKPITRWQDRDDAFYDIAQNIRKVVDTFLPQQDGTLEKHKTPQESSLITIPPKPQVLSLSSVSVNKLPQGTLLCQYHYPEEEQVCCVAWSPVGTHIASASIGKTSQVWDAITGKLLYTYRGHSEGIQSLTWSPDSKHIASTGHDNTVHIWDAMTGTLLVLYNKHTDTIFKVAWSPDGTRIASASGDKTIQVWDALTGQRVFANKILPGFSWSVAWSPDSVHLAANSTEEVSDPRSSRIVGYETSLYVWGIPIVGKAVNFNWHYKIPGASHTSSVVWSPDGSRIASSHHDNKVRVWDASTGNELFRCIGHSDSVNQVDWSPDGLYLASIGCHQLHIWNAIDGTRLFTYHGLDDQGFMTWPSLAWSPDSTRIVSNGNTTIQIWQAI